MENPEHADPPEPDNYDVPGFVRPYHGHARPGHPGSVEHAHPSGDMPHVHLSADEYLAR